MDPNPKTGQIIWTDLTVPNAEKLRDFYHQVVGWTPAPLDMGGYNDFNMCDADGKPVAGVCHARGVNANLPPQWLIYVKVDNLAGSIQRCEELGGKVLVRYSQSQAVIQDPAGAVIMIWSQT